MVREFKLDEKKINLNYVNPIVRDILERVVIPRSRNQYNVDFAIQAIHTSLAHFCTTARLAYVPSGSNSRNFKMTTYYAMSFLSSGKGKDFITDLIENELFENLSVGFDKLIKQRAIQYNEMTAYNMEEWLLNGVTDEGVPYNKKKYNEDLKTAFMPTNIEEIGLRFGQATPEGLAYARTRIKKVDIGSPSLKIPEFSSALSSPDLKSLFTSLIELWENGNMSAKTTKGSLLPNCTNIPILFNAYTDPSKIMNDVRKQTGLVDEFSSGMGRRTFVVYPEEEDFIKKRGKALSEIPQDVIDDITKPIMTNIKKFFNMNNLDTWQKPIQRFSEEAIDYMDRVNDDCQRYEEEHRGRVTDGELANIVSMGAKIEKLASIYAFIEGRLEISIDDCKQATYWSSYTSKYLGKISRVLTPPERLFNMMSRKNDWVSGIEIEQAGIFDKSFDFNKKLDSTLQNLSQYCSINNTDLIVSQRDGGTIIKAKKIPLVDRDKMTTSSMMGSHEYIKKTSTGWDRSKFKFDDLHKFMCGEKEGAITSCEFKDGIRNDENATGRIQFLALDFDDGLSWEDGLERFENYDFFAYQTRSHQKDKNGVKCDRFRIILLLERELVLDRQKYSAMYKKVQTILAPESDKSCSNIGRIFFNSPNSEFVYNDGVPFKAHLFLEESKTEKVYSAKTKLDGSGLKDYFMSEIDIVNSSRTGGVNLLVRASYATKDPMNMSGKEEAKAWIVELSKLIFDDYWKRHNLDKEVMGVLEKVWEN